MATNFEKAFAKMTPAQRKRVTADIGEMMGMPPKRKKATTKSSAKKTTKKK